ncbi:hypothetical protein FHS18_004293 [Paenibacillus phyllosphaerae]|uniref:Uncharacterized protein n=1 Tax=Paenibacillus phyllosphaerae TaxID=274593 RepID=A0A7W5B0L7_9BACL|nr:hypothetical protein [Paenibacillus phyllosphaerae]MBB3112207.1 hypothetical protein [Paenibacillus phyllosphaerae]
MLTNIRGANYNDVARMLRQIEGDASSLIVKNNPGSPEESRGLLAFGKC